MRVNPNNIKSWLNHQVTKLTAQQYLKPVIDQNIDTLVLGCTHYPILKPLLQEILGDRIRLMDSSVAITVKTGELLSLHNLRNEHQDTPEHQFYVTDVPLRFQAIGERFLGRALTNSNVVKW